MRALFLRGVFLVVGLCAVACAVAAESAEKKSDVNVWRFTDLDGKAHAPFEQDSVRGLVLVFVSTDCPIANSYQPLLRRLAARYDSKGIRFVLVYPTRGLTVDQVREHRDQYKILSPTVVDSDQLLTRQTGATVTPQAVVVSASNREVVYRGRIDNRYATFGKKRNVATEHDLADVLDALLSGKTITLRETKSVGCLISLEKR